MFENQGMAVGAGSSLRPQSTAPRASSSTEELAKALDGALSRTRAATSVVRDFGDRMHGATPETPEGARGTVSVPGVLGSLHGLASQLHESLGALEYEVNRLTTI